MAVIPTSRCTRVLCACSVVLLLTAGCEEPTQPTARLSMLVTQDTLVPSFSSFGPVTWMQFTLPIIARNSGPSSVSFDYCAVSVETDDGSPTREAWTPICASAAGNPSSIRPGETLQLNIDVAAAVSGAAGPMWANDSVAGTYRFRAQVLSADGPSPLTITSNAFVLRSSQ